MIYRVALRETFASKTRREQFEVQVVLIEVVVQEFQFVQVLSIHYELRACGCDPYWRGTGWCYFWRGCRFSVNRHFLFTLHPLEIRLYQLIMVKVDLIFYELLPVLNTVVILDKLSQIWVFLRLHLEHLLVSHGDHNKCVLVDVLKKVKHNLLIKICTAYRLWNEIIVVWVIITRFFLLPKARS